MVLLVETVANFLAIYLCVLMLRVIWSWFYRGDGQNLFLAILYQLTDPYIQWVRAVIPPIGGMDLSASFALLGLAILQNFMDRLFVGMASSF